MATKKVIVVGGGVAGMSAAHELIRRGYRVEVYERNRLYCGGKARSVNVPNTNTANPDKYLPGEHGFRFFPGFYKHITATMREIPFKGPDNKPQKDGCFGNLVPTARIMLAQYGKDPILMVARFPKSISDIRLMIRERWGADTGLSQKEESFFAERMWQLMTSSQERRDNEYERIGWWDYLQADHFSKAYQTLLATGLTRTLVAAQAKTASTRTGGGILLQLLFNMANPGVDLDLVLNAPTNEAWLEPWLDDLLERGVQYHFGHEATSLQVSDGRIVSATFRVEDGKETTVEADHFVLAVPVEQAAPLMNNEIVQLDPSLQLLQALAENTNWMNGIQYYLNTNVDLTKGHCIYADSEWAPGQSHARP